MLLPSRDGAPAAVEVTSGSARTRIDQPYDTARVRGEGPLEKGRSSEAAVRETFGAALDAQPMRPVSFIVYFLEGKDELTPESLPVLGQIFAELARRPAPETVVIGHTDALGSHASNDALSLQRAERMRDELVKRGVPRERIHVEGRGKRELLVPTADGIAEPRNRRVEISVR
ncbi:MAG TPA: OmpA family protein [Methylomirabilota bacterium]|nr:OmpA family protein [Methylomirabilota bacterium]